VPFNLAPRRAGPLTPINHPRRGGVMLDPQETKRRHDMTAYKCILVPTDGSRLSLKAARAAATLAKDLQASIKAVYVMPSWSPPMMVDGTGLPAEAFDERAFNKSTEATAQTALAKVEAIARKSRV